MNNPQRRPPSGGSSAGPLYLTRRVSFCAAHRYANPAWSDEQNRAVFGACFNAHGHGHNYDLEVTVRGTVDHETGMVMNLRAVDTILKEEIVARFDHRFINKEVPSFDATVPTVENLCAYMWGLLEPRFRAAGTQLFRVRLYESPDLFGECFGEGEPPGP